MQKNYVLTHNLNKFTLAWMYGNYFQQALTHSVYSERELPLKSTSVKFWAEMRFEIVHMNEEQHKRAV